jgi:uncharacterized protein YgiM (DUF1202 family)
MEIIMSFTLKSAALAATLLVATAGGAFASQYAVLDHDVLVRAYHANGSTVINSADEGDYVKFLAHWGNWYKIKVDGPEGWVKANALDFGGPSYPYGSSPVHACFWGPVGYVCID